MFFMGLCVSRFHSFARTKFRDGQEVGFDAPDPQKIGYWILNIEYWRLEIGDLPTPPRSGLCGDPAPPSAELGNVSGADRGDGFRDESGEAFPVLHEHFPDSEGGGDLRYEIAECLGG